jgi:hypothetical protein
VCHTSHLSLKIELLGHVAAKTFGRLRQRENMSEIEADSKGHLKLQLDITLVKNHVVALKKIFSILTSWNKIRIES